MCNENELLVLKAIADNAQDAAGGDFAFSDELHEYVDLTKNQIKGYLTALQKKGVIAIDSCRIEGRPIHQITLDKRALEILIENGKMLVMEAEDFDVWHH